MKKRGFTLIELLVVIAIIALLATVVLVTLQDARAKAHSTARGQLALQYKRALELYYNDKGFYPMSLGGSCLGVDNANDQCYGPWYSENAALNAELSPYIPGPPASTPSFIVNWFGVQFDMRGIIYSCTNAVNNNTECRAYRMNWVQYGMGTCAGGVSSSDMEGNRICVITS